MQKILKACWPGLFLPTRVILKQRKPGRTTVFENEKRQYEALKALQREIMPICYGEGMCEGRRALVLSDLGGVVPWEQEEMMEAAEFERKLHELFMPLKDYNVVMGDIILSNYRVVGDKVMMLDLEFASDKEPEEIHSADCDVEWLMRQYEIAQYNKANGLDY